MLGLLILFAVAIAIVLAMYVGGIAYEALHPPRANAAWAIARSRPSCPAEMDLDAREWWLDVPGARLPVWEIDLDATPNGLSVIVIHGWGRSRVDSLGRIAPFLERASRVVLLDLRGHGEASGRTRLGDGEESDIVALVERLPSGPVILVGHSLGATVALFAANEASIASRCRGVIALAPYDTVRTPLTTRLAVREFPTGICVTLVLGLLRAFGVRCRSTLDQARRLAAPLLVIHGEWDRIVPLAEAEAIAQARRGELVVIEAREHADLEHSERYLDACRAFMDRIESATENGRAPSARPLQS
jgi:pimeloyl-ACP methyl ester carboxylesterase